MKTYLNSNARTSNFSRRRVRVMPTIFGVVLCSWGALSAPSFAAVEKSNLKKAELNQTSFPSPGNITIAALLSGDRPSGTNCNFNANIWQLAEGAGALSLAVVSGVKLTGSLPGLVGPVPANLQHGKYRVDFSVLGEATSACKGSVSANFEVQRQKLGALVPYTQIINVSPEQPTFGVNEPIKIYVLGDKAAKCGKLNLTIDDKSADFGNITLPYTFNIKLDAPMYPTKSGKHNVKVTGQSLDCTGTQSAVFATSAKIRKGKMTSLKMSGFTAGVADGKFEVDGTGYCAIRFQVESKGSYATNTYAIPPLWAGAYESPIPFPIVRSGLGPLKAGKYRVEVSGHEEQCETKQQLNYANTIKAWYVEFTVRDGAQLVLGHSDSGPGGVPGGGNIPGTPSQATGNITSMLVPGGSFAEDEAQKIQVNGTGGCAMDLKISNVSYGGSYDKTFDEKPLALASSPVLYNGTHFGTLAEGSYSASVKGKNGCTGNAAVDFKVAPKTSISNVLGKPTLSFDKQPTAGSAFSKSKNSNIWLKVALTQAIKTTQFATCCEVEFNFKNGYGGWVLATNSPYVDSNWANAMKLQDVSVPFGVSGFKQGTEWRVKVRASKFKTTFEWSDWLEFKIDQN